VTCLKAARAARGALTLVFACGWSSQPAVVELGADARSDVRARPPACARASAGAALSATLRARLAARAPRADARVAFVEALADAQGRAAAVASWRSGGSRRAARARCARARLTHALLGVGFRQELLRVGVAEEEGEGAKV